MLKSDRWIRKNALEHAAFSRQENLTPPEMRILSLGLKDLT